MARKVFGLVIMLTSDGALGGSGNGSSDGRASSLGGHLGSQTGSKDTGGHCECGVRGDWWLREEVDLFEG